MLITRGGDHPSFIQNEWLQYCREHESESLQPPRTVLRAVELVLPPETLARVANCSGDSALDDRLCEELEEVAREPGLNSIGMVFSQHPPAPHQKYFIRSEHLNVHLRLRGVSRFSRLNFLWKWVAGTLLSLPTTSHTRCCCCDLFWRPYH